MGFEMFVDSDSAENKVIGNLDWGRLELEKISRNWILGV